MGGQFPLEGWLLTGMMDTFEIHMTSEIEMCMLFARMKEMVSKHY
jgi:hypothetical protein